MKMVIHYSALAILMLLLTSTWGQAGYYVAKAHLAQHLIAQAWEQQLNHGEIVAPWSWADTYPIAKLTLDDGYPLYVLAGANNRNLAFGPVLLTSDITSPNIAIAAHNDSHFASLEHVAVGDTIRLEFEGMRKVYQVEHIRIIDQHDVHILSQYAGQQVTLITCYPFETEVSSTNLRYVVQGSLVNY